MKERIVAFSAAVIMVNIAKSVAGQSGADTLVMAKKSKEK